MRDRSGSVVLWIVVGVLLTCILLMGYAIWSTSGYSNKGNAQDIPEIYVEQNSVVIPDPDAVIAVEPNRLKSSEEQEEEEVLGD